MFDYRGRYSSHLDDDERVSNCGKPLSCSFCGDSRSQGKGKTKED